MQWWFISLSSSIPHSEQSSIAAIPHSQVTIQRSREKLQTTDKHHAFSIYTSARCTSAIRGEHYLAFVLQLDVCLLIICLFLMQGSLRIGMESIRHVLEGYVRVHKLKCNQKLFQHICGK